MGWYRLAVAQGDTTAQIMLGVAHAEGRGVAQDFAESARWYQMASVQGHSGAQSFLGYLYSVGQGVPQDNQIAHMWYDIASANGNALSGNDRETIAKKMTSNDISEAQHRARVCMESNYLDCD